MSPAGDPLVGKMDGDGEALAVRASKTPSKRKKPPPPALSPPPPPSSREEAGGAAETLKSAIGPFYNAHAQAARERIVAAYDAGDVEQSKLLVQQCSDLTKSLGKLWCHLHGTQACSVVLRKEEEH